MEWESIRTVEDFLTWLSGAREAPYRRGLDQARREVAGIDPMTTAKRSGATYQAFDSGGGAFTLRFLGQDYTIAYPSFRIAAEAGKQPSIYRQVIMLHYLKTVDDAYVPSGFVSFGALPHGRPYEHSLQKAALEPLARAYADNPNHLRLTESGRQQRYRFLFLAPATSAHGRVPLARRPRVPRPHPAFC
jgi:hypothetical protein